MKIVNNEAIHISRSMYVGVLTDEGITGIDELYLACGTGGTPYLPLAGVKYCADA